MPIYFNDAQDDIQYDYYETLPSKKLARGRMSSKALLFYGKYRNIIHEAYGKMPKVAADIYQRKKQYEEESNAFRESGLYNDPLYHYSVAVSLDAMKEWKTSMKCYVASRVDAGRRTEIGFVHFTEQVVDGRPVVYIAQAGVDARGQGLGRRLMECVLAHYPAGTEFFILTRVFNTAAKTLYEKRLGFKAISEAQVRQLGYDERYCGFNHVSNEAEIATIQAKQTERRRITTSQLSGYLTRMGLFSSILTAAGALCYQATRSLASPRF